MIKDPTIARQDAALKQPFDALREAMAGHAAPDAVEQQLMAAFARQHPRRRWYQRLSPARWALAGGIGSVAAVALVFGLCLRVPMQARDSLPMIARDNGTLFIALDSLERIESERSTHMVETSLPRSALATIGVEITPENAGDTVRAEMLVNAEGDALAVRFLPN